MRRLLYRRDVAVARHRAALARSLGVTDAEMLALVHLTERGELAPSAIAAILDLSSGGVTALVQRLERAGHVTRKPHPSDRRSILIRLSSATAIRLAEASEPLHRGMDAVAAELDDGARAAVTEVFGHLASLSEELEASLRPDTAEEPDPMTHPVPSLWA
jgi:DNA-binding MarR family transcriptional regulator